MSFSHFSRALIPHLISIARGRSRAFRYPYKEMTTPFMTPASTGFNDRGPHPKGRVFGGATTPEASLVRPAGHPRG